MASMRLLVVAVLTVFVASCGGGSPTAPSPPAAPGPSSGGSPPPSTNPPPTPNPPPPTNPPPTSGSSTFTATIDGVAWTASAGVAAQFNNGLLGIGGSDTRQTLGIGVVANRGPGTYLTGVHDPLNVGATSSLMIPGAGANPVWESHPFSGSGSVTLTTLTATGASGTFSLTLAPTVGTGAAGNKVVTGSFNVTFTIPNITPPGGSVNGTISALIDGVPWRGAASARAHVFAGVLNISGQDTDTRLMQITVLTRGAGTYDLSFFALAQGATSTMHLGGQTWTTGSPGGTGTLIVTSLTDTRVTGTFTITMQPHPSNTAPRAAVITDGRFDLQITSPSSALTSDRVPFSTPSP